MDRNSILKGIFVSCIAYLSMVGLFKVHRYLGDNLFPNFAESEFFWGALIPLIANIYWFVPGFFVGFYSKLNPVKSAAVTGLLVGFVVSIYGLYQVISEVDGAIMVAASFFRAFYLTLEYGVLFALAGATGFVASQNKNL